MLGCAGLAIVPGRASLHGQAAKVRGWRQANCGSRSVTPPDPGKERQCCGSPGCHLVLVDQGKYGVLQAVYVCFEIAHSCTCWFGLDSALLYIWVSEAGESEMSCVQFIRPYLCTGLPAVLFRYGVQCGRMGFLMPTRSLPKT